MKLTQIIAGCLLGMLLTACGGGGGSAGTNAFVPEAAASAASGASSATIPAVKDLTLVVPAPAQLSNNSSATLAVTATALDISRNTIQGAVISLSVNNDAQISVPLRTTNSNGQVLGTLSVGENRANRTIKVTATSGGITKILDVQVIGANVTSTLDPAVVSPSQTGRVQYRVVDQAGTAMSNQVVTIAAAGLNPSSVTATTGVNGDYTYEYRAPSLTGNFPIIATIAGKEEARTLIVQPVSSVPNVSSSIQSSSVSASPSVTGVNEGGSTTNRAEIRALFLGANNLPIPNVRVRFDLGGDPNNIGGTFTASGSISQPLYSDTTGVVTTSYVPGAISSPTDGVTVRACYGISNTDPAFINCTSFALVRLTVVNRPLSVSIGSGAEIITDVLTYTKQYIVSVADSAGAAKSDVQLSVSLDLPTFFKGRYRMPNTSATPAESGWQPAVSAACSNEDTNRNGVLESGEDTNGNGTIQPRISDVIVSLLNSKTGADGTAILQIKYAKSFGTWVSAKITVGASGISGTEGRASYTVPAVPIDSASRGDTNNSPAYIVSPYGIDASCSSPN
jgi:hypothetical protein